MHSTRAFSASKTALTVGRLGEHKKLGEDTEGTANLDWPKGNPMLHDLLLRNKSCQEEGGVGISEVMKFVFPSHCYA